MKNGRLLLLVLFSVFLGACARETLKPLEEIYFFSKNMAQVSAQFCTSTSKELRQKIKYIFVIDKSTSNSTPEVDTSGVTHQPTDDKGKNRYKPLVQFLDGVDPDPNVSYYSLVNFSDGAQRIQGFTDDKEAFKTVINGQWHARDPLTGANCAPTDANCVPVDSGFTNYVAALDEVRRLIDEDIQEAIRLRDISSVYNVIFISDGFPRVQTGNQVVPQTEAQVLADERLLFALKDTAEYKFYVNDVILHTGYYFPDSTFDSNASQLLRNMVEITELNSATRVNPFGLAQLFGNGIPIDYSLFAVPLRRVRYDFVDIYLDNASAIWWDDGRLLGDSDTDGLPDEIESKIGSDLHAADTDGNGVSDGIEYRTRGQACRDTKDPSDPTNPACERDVALRYNYTACLGFPHQTVSDGINADPWGTFIFEDRDKDGLNDCEEWVIHSMVENFDSNNDFLPDGMALKNRLSVVDNNYQPLADPDGDGLSNYLELQIGTPPLMNNALLPLFKTRKTQLQKVASVNGSDCYAYTVDDVVLLGSDNLIRLYLIENTATVENKPTVRVAEGRVAAGKKSIGFIDGNFR